MTLQRTGNSLSWVRASILGITISWGVILGLSFLGALLFYKGYLNLIHARIFLYAVLFISALIGTVVAWKTTNERSIYACLTVAFGVAISKTVVAMLVYNVDFLKVIISLVICLAAGVVGILLMNKRKNAKQKRHKRILMG